MVFVNDGLVGAAPIKIDLTPGKHKIRIEAEGYQTWYKTIALSPNETEHFYVYLETLEEALIKAGKQKKSITPVKIDTKDSKQTDKKDPKQIDKDKKKSDPEIQYKTIVKEKIIYKQIGASKTPRFLKWIFWGTGAAALAGGGFMNYMAVSKVSDANDLSPTSKDYYQEYGDTYAKGRSFEKYAYLSYGIGGLSLIAGTILHLLEPDTKIIGEKKK